MAIKFETVTNPPAKPAEKRAAAAPDVAAKPEPGEAGEGRKAAVRKIKSRNNLKKK